MKQFVALNLLMHFLFLLHSPTHDLFRDAPYFNSWSLVGQGSGKQAGGPAVN